MIYTNENWKPPVTYCEPNKVEVQRMTREEAIKVLNMVEAYGLADEAKRVAIEALSAEYEDYEHATLVDIKEPLKVAVVHCKDCKHWTEEKDEEDEILYGWCRAPFENDNLIVNGDDATRILTAYDFFCKSGERSEP